MANTKTKSVSKKAMGEQLMGALKIGGGVLAGNMLGSFIDKALKVDAGAKLPKKLIGPLVMTVGGAIIALKAKDANAKAIATGVAVAGVMRAAKTVMPNSGLAGELGYLSPMSVNANPNSWVLRDQISGHLAYPDLGVIEAPSATGGYHVDAPAYMGDTEMEYISGPDGSEEEYIGGPESDVPEIL